jgi:pyruvate kinase
VPDRRTRIVATLGPATDPPEVLEAVLAAGLDVARLNFSHAAGEEQIRRVERLREAARRAGRNVAILADLPGPKLRVRLDAPLTVASGNEIAFRVSSEPAGGLLEVTEPEWLVGVRPGHRLLFDDGRLQGRAAENDGRTLKVRVEVGGQLLPGKGVNLPDTDLDGPALTPRDRLALDVAVRAGMDWVALSFVRGPEAADELRAELKARGATLPVLAKVERPEAVRKAAAVVEAFDGVMVARGDLGVELPLEEVPAVQKRLIRLARAAGKPVITATDMLDSMRSNPRPTRAEASDVANAIFDGTDAVMLSGETAVGKYPAESVACMDRLARAAEASPVLLAPAEVEPAGRACDDWLTDSACRLARELSADAIVAPAVTSRTVRLLARHRPAVPIVVPCRSEAILRQLALVWGVRPVAREAARAGADVLAESVAAAFAAGALRAGDRVVALAGHPLEGGPRMPTLRLVRVGEGGKSEEL